MTIDARHIAKALDPRFRTNADGGFVAKCPAHDDDKPSLKISDGDKGQPVVYCHAGCSQDSVIDALKGRGLWPEPPKREPKPAAKPKAKIVKTYDYFDPATGELLMQVCRMDPKSFRQRRPDPARPGEWTWSVGAEHRTLYNAVRASQHDKAVFVVEGEKDVDNLAEIGVVATCNPGGAGKWEDSYNEILQGKDVIIVPDNDEAGEKHLRTVGMALQGVAKRVRTLRLPGLPDKGDVTDWLEAGGDRAKLAELVKAATDFVPPPAAVLEAEKPVAPVPANDNAADMPFIPLGYNRGTYYYIARGTQQLHEITASGHTSPGTLLSMADYDWWCERFPSQSGFNASQAASWCMRACQLKGVFNKDDARGRGAWYDDGRIVVHCGDLIYVNRTPHAPFDMPRSRWVYELGPTLPISIDNPITLDEAKQFLALVRMPGWVKDIHALYLAGWCAIAPIGGVLNWRPHVWTSGEAGSGKSWVMDKVVRPILGDFCATVVGATTEAGIRQQLGNDALPVLFDEAEGNDQKSNARIQSILELVRQSSSDGGGKIVKGTVGGNSLSFQVRSCFAFSAINASIVQKADASRITVLELRKSCQKHDFPALVAASAKLLRGDFAKRFVARSITMAPIIRENAGIFAAAVASVMNQQRAGDQLGTLLAGAYSLISDELVTLEQAEAWVGQQDWAETKAEVEDMSDQIALLDRLLQSKVEITINDRMQRMPVYDAVPLTGEDGVMKQLQAEGIRVLQRGSVDRDGNVVKTRLFIVRDALGIKKMLKDSPWESVDYCKVLARLPAAELAKQPLWIAGLGMKRGVYVDLEPYGG